MARLQILLSIAFVFHATTVFSDESDYIGCYELTTLKASKGVDSRQSPYFCKMLCANNFLPIAGVGKAQECYCGTEKQLLEGKKAKEENCKLPCLGDRSQICGGAKELSVYRTSVPIVTTYKGCFTDPKHKFLSLSKGANIMMTPDFCKKLCAANYLPISGTLNAMYCYCGSEDDYETMLKFEQRPEWECAKICRGDTRLTCGGVTRLSVYSTSDAPQPKSKDLYAGCYAAATAKMVLSVDKGKNAHQTPQYCIGICKAQGYDAAGVWYLSGCACGSAAEVKQSTRRPEMECNAACSGDPFQSCGGNLDTSFGYRFSVYWTKEKPEE